MYHWLPSALENDGTIITANLRMSRVLAEAYAEQQIAAGNSAWKTPRIMPWRGWLAALLDTVTDPAALPLQIDAHQSQILWEQSCRREEGIDTGTIASLVPLCRDTWVQLADWQIGIQDVARLAETRDQRLFAAVAGRYLAMLEHNDWVDGAGTGGIVLDLLQRNSLSVRNAYTFAGFARMPPLLHALQTALEQSGAAVSNIKRTPAASRPALHSFDNVAAEMRAAGAWARQQLEQNPEATVGIVNSTLNIDGNAVAANVRDGLTPHWQLAPSGQRELLNVSYGTKLADYPAIAIALTLLRWLVSDLPANDVSTLLRSPLLQAGTSGMRSRIDQSLRELPGRDWSPAMMTAQFESLDEAGDWISQTRFLSKARRDLPKLASPSEWLQLFDSILERLGWPGSTPLDSNAFQLVNRWRKLLNEFASLSLVAPGMHARDAVSRLQKLAADTLFQPESRDTVVQLLGPLEASGLQFERLWISGVSAANWPPTAAPSPLISRRLALKFSLPDHAPADTTEYAEKLLQGLLSAADEVVCSYATQIDDVEQMASELLQPATHHADPETVGTRRPADRLLATANLRKVPDRYPELAATEHLRGGAMVIQRQVEEPFSAFAFGRLGVRPIRSQAVGLPASLRGNLLHDALYRLYADLPDSAAINGWGGDSLQQRLDALLDGVCARHLRNSDGVLRQLLQLEKDRMTRLLQQMIVTDQQRGSFSVAGVEGDLDFVSGKICLPLRYDRIDRFGDGQLAILDYKTGQTKRLLNASRAPNDLQLFVYALACETPVAALALVNIDSREIELSGAGRSFTNEEAWPSLMQEAESIIAAACAGIESGDARVAAYQGVTAARTLNLLSRYTELRREHS